jgi:hypothetical protein
MNRIKTFYDQLYFGFVYYGKNYYSNDFSNYYGEFLLFIFLMAILIPLLIVFWLILDPLTCSINEKYLHIDNLPSILHDFSFFFLVFIFIFYMHYKNRTKKIIKKYKDLDSKSIKKLKRRSGLFAVFSFIWCLIGFIILFIYSQNNR